MEIPQLKTVKLWTARVRAFPGNHGYELCTFFDSGSWLSDRNQGLRGGRLGAFGLGSGDDWEGCLVGFQGWSDDAGRRVAR